MVRCSSCCRFALLGLIVAAAATSVMAEDPFCAALEGIVNAAAAGTSFANLTGADAGTHIQA